VAADVRQGLVSPERAKDAYGVAVDAITFHVDEQATAALRAAVAR